MKIVMMTDSYFPTRDGVVTSLTITKGALEAAGHEVVVAAPDPGESGRLPGVVYFPAAEFRSYPGYYLPLFRSNKMQVIGSLDADVIHIHGIALMAVKALLCARELGIPSVATFHTMVEDTMEYYSPIKMPRELAGRLVWTYLRNFLKRPDAIIAPTQSTADELLAKGARPREVRIIPTGIDTSRFRTGEDGTAIRGRHGLEGKNVLIHVGRISYEKDIGVIVDALAHLPEDTVLLMAGKGPAEESIRALAAEKGVGSRVFFAGFVPDGELVSYYAAADVAVSASRFETQGLSVLEAMAMGLPVVCTAHRAFADFVKDGENGFLFDGGGTECAAAVRRALASGEGIRRNARRTAESFSIEVSAAKHIDVYEFAIRSKMERKEARGRCRSSKRS
ncbi:MAG: glycosyltransferase [Candidatus Methanomethylophilaceae archaeon]|jgi:1,2-diacylglycerol 3-alpha-glucosyltransferase|nr:glycosyltransferase [Candidatus Methanomethylophilaceae archaeon]NLF33309.1 glycosyltransferase family 4 protein [Thermoplasmatales archaeon]